MEIVCPHLPPRAPTELLGILMTALIVLVAGFGASKSWGTASLAEERYN
jgi:hypothetical protein